MMLRRLAYRGVVYPLYHAVKRDGINRARRELDAGQWLAPMELAGLQRRKFLDLLRFAQENVPYYEDILADVGADALTRSASEILSTLPILDKETIRREGARMQAPAVSGRTGYANSTSGSTGEPLRFLTDTTSHAYRLADELRGKAFAGARLGDRHVALWGGPLEISRAQERRGRLHALVTGHRLLSTQDLSPARLDTYIAVVQQFRPAVMTAYPSALEVLAEHCLHRGVVLRDALEGVICSAETLWPYQRELFEQVFGPGRIFNRYGSREVGAIAHECAAHGGLHVSADRLLVEIVDERGHACPPGVPGDVLVTDLESHAMPLIRYRIGDSAVWSEEQACSCGRQLPLLATVYGRSMDVLRAPDGKAVGGTFFTMLLRSQGGIKRFQVNQDKSGAVCIRFVADQVPPAEVLSDFKRQIRNRLGANLPVTFDHVTEIPAAGSGKQRLIASEYRPDEAATETTHAVH